MEVITILIPLAIILALTFIVGFIWMTIHGQYDDLETPAMRMLIDDTKLNPKLNNDNNKEIL
jgi:cbb3-type cytochrome oxidase maturation protein